MLYYFKTIRHLNIDIRTGALLNPTKKWKIFTLMQVEDAVQCKARGTKKNLSH